MFATVLAQSDSVPLSPAQRSIAQQVLSALGCNSQCPTLPPDGGTCTGLDIVCQNGEITTLAVSSAALTGTISSAISGLRALTTLYLNGSPGLHGTVPSGIVSLTRMQYLFLDNTALSGTLPGGLSAMASLNRLRLDRSLLSGPVLVPATAPLGFGCDVSDTCLTCSMVPAKCVSSCSRNVNCPSPPTPLPTPLPTPVPKATPAPVPKTTPAPVPKTTAVTTAAPATTVTSVTGTPVPGLTLPLPTASSVTTTVAGTDTPRTLTVVFTTTPNAAPAKSDVPLIAGVVAAVALTLMLATLAFFLCRARQRKETSAAAPQIEMPTVTPSTTYQAAGYSGSSASYAGAGMYAGAFSSARTGEETYTDLPFTPDPYQQISLSTPYQGLTGNSNGSNSSQVLPHY
jgi:hypothetical protein